MICFFREDRIYHRRVIIFYKRSCQKLLSESIFFKDPAFIFFLRSGLGSVVPIIVMIASIHLDASILARSDHNTSTRCIFENNQKSKHSGKIANYIIVNEHILKEIYQLHFLPFFLKKVVFTNPTIDLQWHRLF